MWRIRCATLSTSRSDTQLCWEPSCFPSWRWPTTLSRGLTRTKSHILERFVFADDCVWQPLTKAFRSRTFRLWSISSPSKQGLFVMIWRTSWRTWRRCLVSLGARVPGNRWEHVRNIEGTGSIYLACFRYTHFRYIPTVTLPCACNVTTGNISFTFEMCFWHVPNIYPVSTLQVHRLRPWCSQHFTKFLRNIWNVPQIEQMYLQCAHWVYVRNMSKTHFKCKWNVPSGNMASAW